MDGWMTVNDDLRRMWKKAVVIHFKVLSFHMAVGTKGNHEK
jgi:hypothetical protein